MSSVLKATIENETTKNRAIFGPPVDDANYIGGVWSYTIRRDRDPTLWRAMAARRRTVQRHVLRKMFAAALMTSYIVSVAQALNCGAEEFYDEVIDECRSCRLLCDPVYGTKRLCADKCPGTEHVYTFTRNLCRNTRHLLYDLLSLLLEQQYITCANVVTTTNFQTML